MKKIWEKKWVRRITYCMIPLILLFLFRNPILRGMGNWLVADDPMEQTECAFVLGGNSFERGLAAVEIAKLYPSQKFVTSGGNVPMQISALDTTMYEAQLTRHFMMKKGVPDSQITIMSKGTSTFEESDAILDYCKQHGLKKVSIISSNYHLRRVRWVFEDKFKENGIIVLFHGAPSAEFLPNEWWKHEEGLITTNNEYIKLLYYFIKH